MKLSKVLMTVAAAAALVGFAGCATDEDKHDMITVKGDTAYIEATNDTNDTWRGFKTLKTKHTDADALFTINPDDLSEVVGRAGVIGFVFDLNETKNVVNTNGDKKKVYDFTAVSFRLSGGQPQAYISRFEGVDADNMDGKDNFKDIDGEVLSPTGTIIGGHNAKETEVLKGSSTTSSTAYANLALTKVEGAYKCYVDVKANDNGTYTVTFYDGNVAANFDTKGKLKDDANPIVVTGNVGNGVTVEASWTLGPVQTQMGFYAATYGGATMKGTLQLPEILNEDEVVEWDD